MHELSIARAIVAEVESSALEEGIATIEEVRLKVGALCGVIGDSLNFCFELAADGTVVAGAKLAIERVPVLLWCGECERAVVPENQLLFQCPECKALCADLLSGRELEIVGYSGERRCEGVPAW